MRKGRRRRFSNSPRSVQVEQLEPKTLLTVGNLDPSFGTNGFLIDHYGDGENSASDVEVLSDGSILAATTITINGSVDFAVVKYHNDGSIDSAFGINGVASVDIGATDTPVGIEIQSDGKIVVGGNTSSNVGVTSSLAFMRLTSSGQIDTTFGNSGVKVISPTVNYEALADLKLTSDDSIVGAGYQNREFYAGKSLTVKLTSDGVVDGAFGTSGSVIRQFPGHAFKPTALDIGASGDITIVGDTRPFDTFRVHELGVLRLNSDGNEVFFNRTELTYPTSSPVSWKNRTNSSAVVTLPDGSFYVGGNTSTAINGVSYRSPHAFLAKYTAEGQFDVTSSNNRGWGAFTIASFSDTELIEDLKIDEEGRIVATGGTHDGSTWDSFVARFTYDGTFRFDLDFGNNGRTATSLSDADDRMLALAFQSDGSIVTVGYAYDDDSVGIAFSRTIGIKRTGITWLNRQTDGFDVFDAVYGTGSASLAREIVDRALDDWNSVILDFNFDDDDDLSTGTSFFPLTIGASAFTSNSNDPLSTARGYSQVLNADATHRPTAGLVQLDDDAAGGQWIFETADSEFSDLVTPFAGVNPHNASTGNDFYRTVVHEIGHTLGFSGFESTRLSVNDSAMFESAGVDQRGSGAQLYRLRVGTTNAVFIDLGGLHLYEGPLDPAFSSGQTYPFDLMNSGRIRRDTGDQPLRQIISDVDARILSEVYGYVVDVPEPSESVFRGRAVVRSPNQATQRMLSVSDTTDTIISIVDGVQTAFPVSIITSIEVRGGILAETIDVHLDDGHLLEIVVSGGGGGDSILINVVGSYSVIVQGGDGNDYVDASASISRVALHGDKGNDTLIGGAGDDFIDGGAGNDAIFGRDGNDFLSGNSGNDLIRGEAGSDMIFGDDGLDTLEGGSGHDVLHGGADDDFLHGGEGIDELYGDDGNDSLHGGVDEELDVLFGGMGADRLYSIFDSIADYEHGVDFLINQRPRERNRRRR